MNNHTKVEDIRCLCGRSVGHIYTHPDYKATVINRDTNSCYMCGEPICNECVKEHGEELCKACYFTVHKEMLFASLEDIIDMS